jgi:hypothetical protein
MLIAETLALIALDTASGRTKERFARAHYQFTLANALLMELATQMRLGLRGDRVVVLDNLPSRHMLLTSCLKTARAHSGLLSPRAMVERVARELPQLRDDLLDALVRRDILHPPVRAFKLFGAKRYAVRSTQAQNEGFDEIRRCAIGENSKLHGIALLSLSAASGVLDQLLTHNEVEDAKARLRTLHEEIAAELANDDGLELGELHSIALMERLYQELLSNFRDTD